MTTDDALLPTTDAWGRPVLEDGPRFGPLDGDESSWPSSPMLVLSDEDLVTCATGFARAFSSEYFFTIWLIAVGDDGWTTKAVAELLDMPRLPPPAAVVRRILREMAGELHELSPATSVVVAIADPDGGDRGDREVAWTGAILAGAAASGVAVHGVVAVGAHRARLLYSAAGSTARWPTGEAMGEEDTGVETEPAMRWDEDTEWARERDADDEWEPFSDGPLSGVPIPAKLRDTTDLAVYASMLYDQSPDPDLLVHLLSLGPDGTVLWDPLVVHGLPDLPEEEDRAGFVDVLQAAVGPLPEGRRVVAAVLLMPDDAAVDSAHQWAEVLRDAARVARVRLWGVVAVDADQAVVLVRPEEAW